MNFRDFWVAVFHAELAKVNCSAENLVYETRDASRRADLALEEYKVRYQSLQQDGWRMDKDIALAHINDNEDVQNKIVQMVIQDPTMREKLSAAIDALEAHQAQMDDCGNPDCPIHGKDGSGKAEGKPS